MAEKTREELAQEASDALRQSHEDFAAEQRKAAEEARAEAPDTAETEEEYQARVAAVRSTQIFGDTETAVGGPTASGTDVPSHDNEAATVAVAEADAAAQTGDDEADAASHDEARRQVEIQGVHPDAAEVDAAADDDNDDDTANADDDGDDNATAQEQIDAIENASTVEEVDSIANGDERVTVQRAADKRRAELSE